MHFGSLHQCSVFLSLFSVHVSDLMRCSNKMQTFVCHPLIAMINDEMNPHLYIIRTLYMHVCTLHVWRKANDIETNTSKYSRRFSFISASASHFECSFFVAHSCQSPTNVYFVRVCIKQEKFSQPGSASGFVVKCTMYNVCVGP